MLGDPNSGSGLEHYLWRDQATPTTQTGRVLKTYPGHRADVALLNYVMPNGVPLVLRSIPVSVNYAGKGWGEYTGLRKGQLVQVSLDNGSGVNAQIIKTLYTDNGEPCPQHPLLQTDRGHIMSWALQQPMGAHDVPGNLDYRGADGSRIEIVLGKELKESAGQKAERLSGPAVSRAEAALYKSERFANDAQQDIRQVATLTRSVAEMARTVAEVQASLARLDTQVVPETGSTVAYEQRKRDLRIELERSEIRLKNASRGAQELAVSSQGKLQAAADSTRASAQQVTETALAEVEVLKMTLGAAMMDPTALLN